MTMTAILWEKIHLPLRIALFVLALSAGMVVLLAGMRSALAAAGLKDIAVVSGDMLTLGDLFDGLQEEQGGAVLGPAPQPGQDMVLNARTLYRIAVAMDVAWRPAGTGDQVIVRRAATTVSYGDLESGLKEALKNKGLEGDFVLSLNQGMPEIVLPSDYAPRVEVASLRFDPQADKFDAVLAAPSADNPVKRLSVSGHVERMIPVPVLKNALRNGDIIGAADLDWIDLPARQVKAGTLLRAEDVTGMTPRRAAFAGKPLMEQDVERPKLVERGGSVTILFEDGPLVLSAKGRALQTGAMGDAVRVSNLSSNKTLQGVVTGGGEVTIH